MWSQLRKGLERFLEVVVALLLVTMVVIVVMGVLYRKFGDSLVWYDEIASVVLAWLTYYGAALAALKRAHIGFSGLVDAAPKPWRLVMVCVAEIAVVGFFVLLAWMGYEVLVVLEGDTLVSLPEVSTQITQSVIPIGAALFILAQLASLPEVIRRARGDAPAGGDMPGTGPPIEP